MKNQYIDFLRGIAIFLMLWGHFIQVCSPIGVDFFENGVFRFIYSFHMPLFMLISGYLFRFSLDRKDTRELIRNRCGGLLRTVVLCNVLIFFLSTGVSAMLRGDLSPLLEGRCLSSLTGLWFLWSVLGASLVTAVAFKCVHRAWQKALVLTVGALFVLMLPNGTYNLFMYPYFLLGLLFATYREHLPKAVLRLRYLSLVLFPVLLLFFEKKHYIYTTGLFGDGYTPVQYLGIDLYRFLIGLVGSIFVAVLAEHLFHLLNSAHRVRAVYRWFTVQGEKSLQFYVLSTLFLSTYLLDLYPKIAPCVPSVDAFFARYSYLFSFGVMLPLAILLSIGLGVLIRTLEKSGLSKILFGR